MATLGVHNKAGFFGFFNSCGQRFFQSIEMGRQMI